MTPIYAIGDIHGQHAMLETALARIEKDGGSDALIVFLGDYTDRGPDSRAVIETLIQGRDAGRNWTFIKGNHDRMFEWFLEVPSRVDPYLFIDLSWLHEKLGGNTTLASYGVDFTTRRRLADVHAEALELVPTEHVDFLKSCVLSHETATHYFCHAGINPNVGLDQQSEHDLLWIREPFHNHTAAHPKLIVHGHTPIKRATHFGNRVDLDTGAGFGDPLTAAVFDADGCWILTETGRQLIHFA